MHTASAIILVGALASVASAADVVHVPPAQASAGAALELVAEAPAATPTLRVFYRSHVTAGEFTALDLVRKDDARWVAVVPAAAVTAPGLDYYIAAGDAAVFASATTPHTMPVVVVAEEERRTRDSIRSGGRRSRIGGSFEYVDFGKRRPGGTGDDIADSYYRVDADFAYRLWLYPLEELRVGYTRLIGVVEDGDDEGFRVGGWFELGLAPVEGVRFDARAMVMATQAGFAPGARGELRVGDRDATHIATGVEYLADVGTNGFFRLGWGTVPGLPMAATVEITNIPSEEREVGVRLFLDIARVIVPGVRLGLRGGYAAREDRLGFTSGANLVLDL